MSETHSPSAIALGLLAAVLVTIGTGLAGALYHFNTHVSEARWTTQRIEGSTAEADQIIAWLEQHHEATGQYPESLGDLVPTHTPSLPRPTTGNRDWGYRLTDGAGQAYELAFYANRDLYPSMTYDSQSKQWTLDQ